MWQRGAKLWPRSNLSYQDYVDWKKMNKVFSALEAYTGGGYLMKTSTGVEPVNAARVTAGFFRVLGVKPMLGRDFYDGEDQPSGGDIVILTYQSWQERFGGRKDIIGQMVDLDGVPNTIIGVLPANFQFAPRGRAEFWGTVHKLSNCEKRRSCHNMFGVARLKDGVTVESALADMTAIAKQLEVQYPGSNRDQGASVKPLYEQIVGDIRPILLVLLGGAVLLLVIACVNVSSLSAGAVGEPEARDCGARGAGGVAVAAGAAVRDRSTAAGGGGRSAWCVVAYGRNAGAFADDLEGHAGLCALSRGGQSEPSRVVLFAVAICVLAAGLFALTPILRVPLTTPPRGTD